MRTARPLQMSAAMKSAVGGILKVFDGPRVRYIKRQFSFDELLTRRRCSRARIEQRSSELVSGSGMRVLSQQMVGREVRGRGRGFGARCWNVKGSQRRWIRVRELARRRRADGGRAGYTRAKERNEGRRREEVAKARLTDPWWTARVRSGRPLKRRAACERNLADLAHLGRETGSSARRRRRRRRYGAAGW